MSSEGRGTNDPRRFFPVAATGLLALVQLLLGHPLRASAAMLLALGLLGVALVGIDVAGAIGRGVRAVVGLVGTVLVGGLYLVTILPAWAWTKVRRRSALRSGLGWQPLAEAPGVEAASLAAAALRPAPPSSWVYRVRWAVGLLVLLLVFDTAAGSMLHRLTGSEGIADPDPVEAAGGVPRDPRVDGPALASSPWAEDFFYEMGRAPVTYWPFTEVRQHSFRGRYLNLDGQERRSYQPDVAEDVVLPTVWFLGSSTTFGEGQRDEHTIASQIARLAEAEGIPVRVRNFGVRGFVHFQEMLLYEQLLATEPNPEFSVFIDGANEIAGQVILEEEVPAHLLTENYAQAFAGIDGGSGAFEPAAEPSAPHRIWRAYRANSLLAAAVDWVNPPAGAEPRKDPDFGSNENGARALRVYERGRALSLVLSEEHGVDPLFVWQPFNSDQPSFAYVRDHLSSPTVDVSDALLGNEQDHIDEIHTNEHGADLVARAIWEQLRPKVEGWYADQ